MPKTTSSPAGMKNIKLDMKELIKKYHMQNRVAVGDDSNSLVGELARNLGAKVLSLASGTECLTWVIPDKWTVREAYIETARGERVVDFKHHPMYLKSYSASFSGKVTREELIAHTTTDKSRPDRLIYDYRWQYQYGDKKEWGFSIPYNKISALNEKHYMVHIDTSLEKGNMDVLDFTLRGRIPDTIFIAAHTCHPGQVNDGLVNVALGCELFKWLKQKSSRRFTYRLICGPEYFAAAAILQKGDNVDKLKYGFFLDMLGTDKQLGFSGSHGGNSHADKATRNIFKYHVKHYTEKPNRCLWGNDEMFYEGPGFEIPTVCVGRDKSEHHHTDLDNAENCDFRHIEEALGVMKKIIDVFETDCVPKLLYKGPLYLSRFGLYIDPKKNLEEYLKLHDLQILMNGKSTFLEIADALGIDYSFVRSFAEKLSKKHLVTIKNKC